MNERATGQDDEEDDLRQWRNGVTAHHPQPHKVIETIILGFVKKAGIAGWYGYGAGEPVKGANESAIRRKSGSPKSFAAAVDCNLDKVCVGGVVDLAGRQGIHPQE